MAFYDLYFLPGGNPSLKSEQGWSYDAGLSAEFGKNGIYRLTAGVNWFDSRIDDWIMWLPTTKGFFSPRNMKRVHAYGIEANATGNVGSVLPSAGIEFSLQDEEKSTALSALKEESDKEAAEQEENSAENASSEI